MPETYEKKNKDTLLVTYEEKRAKIQAQLDCFERGKVEVQTNYQKKIDILKAKIAVLDG